ncbi:type VI secretion system ATPase TssH [Prosthecobacter sp.]|uniref:type VI secretion system ATPase TssH n=1 Tax=Prosthecobacter sp. TaxID=1965333 RepID=UPI003783AA40
MAEIRPADLFGRLNRLGYKCMESAATFCKLRGNPKIELIHFLHQVFNEQDSDLHRIVQHFGLDASKLSSHMQRSLDLLPRGASSISGFSQSLREASEQGWVYASLMYKQGKVRTGHIVVGMLKSPSLAGHFLALSDEFRKINADVLTDELTKIITGSPEDGMTENVGAGATPGEASGAVQEEGKGGSALAQFAVDLTQRARDGEIDPILGRDEEIRQIVDILMRRRQNNPILTGEAGVGKTAVVEGFAMRIASGDVPPALREVRLCSLDLGLLQAGASMKGEFEERLKKVIEEVQASPKPIILFIDEAHTLIGAGGQAGQNDAANLLKPALARGTLRTIAATTWAEYKKYFEKDPALTRRFQVIKVEEPDEEKAVRMIRGLAPVLEKHHKVPVLDSALEAAARLSGRYIPSRQLPDKAVSLIDTACARVAISQHATPAEVEDATRLIEVLKTEIDILDKEGAIGLDHAKRKADVSERIAAEEERLAGLTTRWEAEKELVKKLLTARESAQKLEAEGRDALLATCLEIEKELSTMQGETPLVFPHVDEHAVAAVISDWTGIPAGRMVKNEIEQTLKLADILERRVIGQRHALDTIARRVQTSRARLDNPNRPIGVFMLAGPSGTGKTETALTLAETLFGDESSLISINMSEFQESHTVSTLKGAPPGYVGYGEGGKLTEAVRRRPYSVVLLDEVEKAHPDVHEIFFQVFDKGWMEDGEGRFIDFKNTLIILTSNAAQDVVTSLCKDPELMPDAEALEKAMRLPLTKVFPDALLNRLVVVPYYPISQEMLRAIIKLNLRKVEKRVKENHGIPFTYGEDVIDLIVQRCTELERGARLVDAIVTNQLLPEIGREFLTRMMEGRPLEKIAVIAKDGEFAFEF